MLFFHCPLIKNPDHKDIAGFDLKIREKGTCSKCGAVIQFISRYDVPWVEKGVLFKEVFFHREGRRFKDCSGFVVHSLHAVYNVD